MVKLTFSPGVITYNGNIPYGSAPSTGLINTRPIKLEHWAWINVHYIKRMKKFKIKVIYTSS